MVVAFSSLARILGELSTIHFPLALFFFFSFFLFFSFFFFFFEVEISSRTVIQLFWPESVHSGSVTVAEFSLTGCV